jgi:hypothetical protein
MLTSIEGGNMTVTATEEQIFDASSYELPIPSLDGHKADRLAVTFTGGVDLDRTSEEDLDFVGGLRLGQQITLTVTATVTKKGFTLNPGKDDTPETTGYGVVVKVHSWEIAG